MNTEDRMGRDDKVAGAFDDPVVEPPKRKPTWQCEFCGRFYSERTAKDHAYCVQAYDRECFERAFPYG